MIHQALEVWLNLYKPSVLLVGQRQAVQTQIRCQKALLVLCILSDEALGWSAVCDCGISWPYSLTLEFLYFSKN